MLRKLSPLCGIMLSQLISLSELSPLYEIALSALVSLSKFNRQNSHPTSNPGGGGGGSSPSSKDAPPPPPPFSAADRIEHQRRKVKLLSMLDEACIVISLSFFLFPSYLLSPIKSQGPPISFSS